VTGNLDFLGIIVPAENFDSQIMTRMGLGGHPEIDHPNFIGIMSHQVNANLITNQKVA